MTQQLNHDGDGKHPKRSSKSTKQAKPQTRAAKQPKQPTPQSSKRARRPNVAQAAETKAPSQAQIMPEDWPFTPLIEHIYPIDPERPAAFDSINQAVCSMVDRFTYGQAQPRVVNAGYVAYDKVPLPDVVARISVIRATPSLVFVQFHVTALVSTTFPRGYVTDRALHAIAHVLTQLDRQVETYLRAGFRAGDFAPPVPDSGDWEAVFAWQRIYHPTMTDEQLAELLHMETQSIANARTRAMASRKHADTPAEAARMLRRIVREYEASIRRSQEASGDDQPRTPRGRPRP